MRALRRGGWLPVVVLSLLLPATARADGFAIEKYEPTSAGSWFFGVNHPWYSSTRYFAAGLTLDYAHNPLLAGTYDSGGNNFHKTAAVVEHMLVGHIDLAGSFLDRVQVSATLPITFFESGTAAFGVAPLSGAAVGDPRVGAMVRLWGQPDKDPVSIHFGVHVWIPVGGNKKHQGDVNARGLPQVILAGLVKDHLRWAFNGGVLIREQSTIGFGPANSDGTELQLSVALGYADKIKRFNVGPELLFGTVLVGGHAFKQYYSNLDLLVGGNYNIAKLVQLGVAVGAGLLGEIGTPDVRVLFRAAYAPIREEKAKPIDSDGDGIYDPEDACPHEAGARNADPRINGCPDRDHDGVVDLDDLCPDEPMGAHPDPNKRGCPLKDTDKDGVFDNEDLCPTVPQGDHPDPKKKGCPFKDKDGDGVSDDEDMCPDVPAGKIPDPKKPGCPLDQDGDGIIDEVDACPDKPGVADPDPKLNGCPKLVLRAGEATELKMVLFETNKSVLLPSSFPVLDDVVKILNESPEVKHVLIEGHADDTGTHAWNLRLSNHRAKAVMDYLIKHGVSAKRLDYKGFGDTRPVMPGTTDEARTANRRVEIRLMDKPSSKKDKSGSAPPAAKDKPADKPAEKP